MLASNKSTVVVLILTCVFSIFPPDPHMLLLLDDYKMTSEIPSKFLLEE